MWDVLGHISNTVFKDTMIKSNVSSEAKKNYVSKVMFIISTNIWELPLKYFQMSEYRNI